MPQISRRAVGNAENSALGIARTTQSYETQGKIDVFLHEGLIDDAIAALGSYASHTIIAQVVDVAIKERPEWAIQASKKQAESIMDGGKRNTMTQLPPGSPKAHKAYQTLNRNDEWQAYFKRAAATAWAQVQTGSTSQGIK